MKSISFKIGLIYVLLTIFIVSFFTVAIYIEQNDLIVKNRELEINLRSEKIYEPLKYQLLDSLLARKKPLTQKEILAKAITIIDGIGTEKYIVFTEKGAVLYKSSKDLVLEDINLKDSISAIANREFLNHPYLIQTNSNDQAYVYIPVGTEKEDGIILMFIYKLENIEVSLDRLYRVVITVVVIVLIMQILFGIFFYAMVIRPIKEINKKSLEIKGGDLASRVMVKKKDELGQLGQSFNEMAASIEEKINQLSEKNEIMEFELNAAGDVQAGIYPTLRNSKLFDIAIHHRPLETVSGDYHDIFRIAENKYGFLIVDVSGHGVPAALTTLRIQDTFKRLVTKYSDTARLFAHANAELDDLMEKFSCYFTAFYLSLDGERNIAFTNGGHPLVYLFHSDTKMLEELGTDGFPLGVTQDASDKYRSKTRKIEPGDKVILFTDGITEAKNEAGEQYSTERLEWVITKNPNSDCETLKNTIIADLNAFVGKARRKDDETLMVIEIKAPPVTSMPEKPVGLLQKALRSIDK